MGQLLHSVVTESFAGSVKDFCYMLPSGEVRATTSIENKKKGKTIIRWYEQNCCLGLLSSQITDHTVNKQNGSRRVRKWSINTPICATVKLCICITSMGMPMNVKTRNDLTVSINNIRIVLQILQPNQNYFRLNGAKVLELRMSGMRKPVNKSGTETFYFRA